MCVIDWTLVLEYFRALLSWPPMAFAIVFMLARRFRSNIAGLIDRVRSAKWGDKEVLLAEVQQEQAKKNPGSVEPPGGIEGRLEGPAGAPGDGAARNRAISQDTADALGGVDPEPALRFIEENPGPTLDQYMALQVALYSERIWNMIYGTQIFALDHLATFGPRPASELVQFFDRHVELSGLKDRTFESWVSFMGGQGLIFVRVSEAGKSYGLTTQGLQFLKYTKSRYPLLWDKRPF